MTKLKEPKAQTLKEIQEESHNFGTSIPGAPNGQKPKKSGKKDKAALDETDQSAVGRSIDRQIRGVQILPSGKVVVVFVELVTQEPKDGEDESSIIENEYKLTSKYKPHKDLLDALKKLRKDWFSIMEMDVPETPKLKNITVSGIKIQGDLVMKQSRVTMTLTKLIERTGKLGKFPPCPQVTMYGESDYDGAAAMAKLIEEVVAEAWLYVAGKYEDETPNQLPLFER